MSKIKSHNRKFLKTYLEDKSQIGAIAPSSRFLVSKMCDNIDFKSAKTIIELGPGTGVFTEEIIRRASNDSRIILIELNEEFVGQLKSKFIDKRVEVIQSGAEKLESLLKKIGVDTVDTILSSLPLSIIPERIRMRILIQCHNVLKKNGIFTQYQYSLNEKKLVERVFGPIQLRFVAINIPPAFIYVAQKLK